MKRKKRMSVLVVAILLLVVGVTLWYFSTKEQEDAIIIAIDPGHGGPGIEQGYQTVNGTHECVMNNAVSKYLAEILTERGYEVVYTKEPLCDVYLYLDDRPAAANAAQADLMISIHHDSSGDPERVGFRIFYSSYKVNLDTDGIVVLYGGKEYSLISERTEWDEDGDSYTVKVISDGTEPLEINSNDDYYKIIDTTPCDAAVESQRMAYLLYDKMVSLDYIVPYSDISNTVVDEEYRVLRYADIPSVLVEAGFMSNEEESIAIQNNENQQALALAIADAVDAYFDEK